MVKAAHKYRQENGPLHYFVFHGGAAAEDAQKLKTRLKKMNWKFKRSYVVK